MKSFRLFVCIASGAVMAGGLVSGCGGDDTVVSPGSDGGKDATTDGSNFVDGSSQDSGGQDGGGDTGVIVDAGPPPTVTDFVAHLEQAYCTRIAQCCVAADAGTISNAKCLFAAHPDGFLGASTGIIQLLDEAADGGGTHINNLVVDSQLAKNCYQATSLVPCSLGTTLANQVIASCFNAVQGKLAIGGACETSVECKQPAYCKYADGGAATGVCTALEAVGSLCNAVPGTSFDQGARGQEACSSRSSGVPAAYCDNEFLDYTLKPIDQWKCAAGNANSGICAYDTACVSNLCDPTTGTCTPNLDLASSCSILK